MLHNPARYAHKMAKLKTNIDGTAKTASEIEGENKLIDTTKIKKKKKKASSKDENFDEIINAKIGSESQDARRRDRKIKFKAFVKDCDNKKKDSDFDPEHEFDEKPKKKKKGAPEPISLKKKRGNRVPKIPKHEDEADLLNDDSDTPKKKKAGRPAKAKKHKGEEDELEADESDIDKPIKKPKSKRNKKQDKMIDDLLEESEAKELSIGGFVDSQAAEDAQNAKEEELLAEGADIGTEETTPKKKASTKKKAKPKTKMKDTKALFKQRKKDK